MASPTVDESVMHDRIGVAMENLNRSNDAIAEFRTAIASRSTNVTAMFHLADTLAARGDLIGALSQSDQVLRLMPDATDALHATADWLLKLHRPAEAEGRLRHLLTIDPADVPSRLTLANLELQLNQPDAAARDFSAVIQLEPNNAAASQGLVEALARQYRPTSVPATQSM
jgi:tetratricopeptide (TPR) repeat protein